MANQTLAKQREMQIKMANVSQLCEGVKDKYRGVELINERIDRKFKEKVEEAGRLAITSMID